MQFPLTQSFVMSNLVQPFLPAFTPAEASSLQIKKTSWKNIKRFIKSLDKAQIIKSKDRDGNEVVIMDIDFDDRHVLNFVPYKLPKKETAAGTSAGRGDKATTITDENDDSVGQKLRKIEVYRPKEKLTPIFSSAKADPQGYFTAAELRPIVTAYIESENLISTTNKRLVTLNPLLSNAVFDGSAPSDNEIVTRGSVPRDALFDRVIRSCAPFWSILREGESLDGSAAAGHGDHGAGAAAGGCAEGSGEKRSPSKLGGGCGQDEREEEVATCYRDASHPGNSKRANPGNSTERLCWYICQLIIPARVERFLLLQALQSPFGILQVLHVLSH